MKKIFETPNTGNYFFGYYDKSPLNADNSLLLACRTNFIHRAVECDDVLDIGYFNYKESSEFIKIATTRAWNWQQGCMLQWFGDGSSPKIIYNDISDDKFVTVIFNIKTGEQEHLPMAYYAMSGNGRFVLCIDNERHAFYRPNYSYKGIENLAKKQPFLGNDGIWFMDLKTKDPIQVISLRQVVDIKPLSSMKDAIHYLEHLMISPNNNRFMFLHRWKVDGGGLYSRLYTADVDGSNLHLLNDSGRVTHMCWKNDKEIVGWAGIENPLNNLRKYKKVVKYFIQPLMPLYKRFSGGNSVEGNSKLSALVSGDSYVTFVDKTNVKSRISQNELIVDGHPSFSKENDNLLLTDTYPIKINNNKQELILFDLKSNTVISRQYLNHLKYARSPMRCDLHPKWSHNGKLFAIDTIDGGYRSIFVYEI